MKFVVAVVMLALAVSVNASLYASHYAPAVSYVNAHGPAAYGAHGAWGYGPWGGHGPAAISIDHGHGWGPSGHGLWGGIPGISLSQGPHGHGAPLAVHAAAPSHGHGHEGVYVAKTLGAIHTAPLAGHVNSATSLNLAPAPGTH